MRVKVVLFTAVSVALAAGAAPAHAAFPGQNGKLAFTSDRSGNYDIWTLDVASGVVKQVSRNPREDRMPSWSPDGARIVYAGTEGNKTALYTTALADGAESLLRQAEGRIDAPSFGPGGELAYVVQDAKGSRETPIGRLTANMSPSHFPTNIPTASARATIRSI